MLLFDAAPEMVALPLMKSVPLSRNRWQPEFDKV
jgi:hypothetical protein